MGQLTFLTRLFFINFMCLLFAFQPTAWALSVDQKSQLKDFLTRTELTKKDVSFFDYYWSLRGILPEPVRKEFATWAALNPLMKMTQMKFQIIKDSQGKEVIQFLATQGKQSVSGTMSFLDSGEPVVKVGKTIFRMQDIQDTRKFFEKLGKEIEYKGGYIPSLDNQVVILKAEEVEKLTGTAKKEYYKNYLKLLEASEKFQVEMQGKKTSQNLFFDLLIEKAYANGVPRVGFDCISAGYSSRYIKNAEGRVVCQVKGDTKICEGRGLQCNPQIYGHKDLCSGSEPENVLYATKNCNNLALFKDDGTAARYFFSRIKNKEEFNKEQADVEKTLLDQLRVCELVSGERPEYRLDDQYSPVEFPGGKPTAEAKSACGALKNQIAAIKKVTCGQVEELAKKDGSVPHLTNMCNPIKVDTAPVTQPLPPAPIIVECKVDDKNPKSAGADAPAAPAKANNGNATGTTTRVPVEERSVFKKEEPKLCTPDPKTNPAQSPVEKFTRVACSGPGHSPTEMACGGVPGARFSKVWCEGASQMSYHCDCGPDAHPSKTAGGFICVSSKQLPFTGSNTPAPSKPSKPFWQSPWVQAAFKFAIGGAILGLMYYFGKKQVKAQTEFLMPSGTPTPVPPPAPTPRPRSGAQ